VDFPLVCLVFLWLLPRSLSIQQHKECAMTLARLFLPLVIAIILLANPHPAAAQGGHCTAGCLQIYNYADAQCTGPNCSDSYPIEICIGGCNCGTCGTGGYGLCCGHSYSVPIIYQAPGICCANLPVRNHTHLNREPSARTENADLWTNQPSGLIMLTPTQRYRPPTFVYAYNRCSHIYTLITDEVEPKNRGGL